MTSLLLLIIPIPQWLDIKMPLRREMRCEAEVRKDFAPKK
jgi:hypothetical protein